MLIFVLSRSTVLVCGKVHCPGGRRRAGGSHINTKGWEPIVQKSVQWAFGLGPTGLAELIESPPAGWRPVALTGQNAITQDC